MRRSILIGMLVLLGAVFAGNARATTIIDKGVAAVTTTVSCGAHSGVIEVRTGVHFAEAETADFHSGVSVGFSANAGNTLQCCWVQFFWVEVTVTVQTPGGGVLSGPMGGATGSLGGVVNFSTPAAPGGPVVPRWHVDSLARKNPCYEAGGGSHFKDATSATIFDAPANVASVMAPLVRVPPRAALLSVESRIHFETYLVCDRNICGVVIWEQRNTWQANAAGPPTVTGPDLVPPPTWTPGGALRPEQKAAAAAKFPGQTILPP